MNICKHTLKYTESMYQQKVCTNNYFKLIKKHLSTFLKTPVISKVSTSGAVHTWVVFNMFKGYEVSSSSKRLIAILCLVQNIYNLPSSGGFFFSFL